MADDDGWPAAELTRSFQRLESRFDKLDAKLDVYAKNYVSRELHDRDVATLTDKHIDLAKWVTDIAADGDRAARDRAEIREQHAKDLAAIQSDYREECSAIREQMITRKAALAMVTLLVAVVAACATVVAVVVR